ncbi:group I intron-associated PD-(D/E)XK endonuclease [Mariniblastus sp.]|nr:group I intron-associated PD-(D/E)XK endonuclease [Mariniblastus sp.]
MDTNHVGDIAEQAVTLKCLEMGWGVCLPVGNRLPYDLIVDTATKLVRVQVKSAWLDESSGNYVTDNRRTKTNRRRMIRDNYSLEDFDVAVVYLTDVRVFYAMPVDVFIGYGSSITFVETIKRQRKPKSAEFRDRWDIILANS